MLNLNDIISLAKQGYKPSDIKELIELSKSEDETTKKEDFETPSEDDLKKEQPAKIPSEDDLKKETPSGEIVDYKEKVKELEAKLHENETLLQKLQKENTKRNADTDPKKSDADVFAEAMKSFM